MQDDARSVLAQLIHTHGQDLVDDHRRLRSMLADSLPGSRREAQRLVAAAEEGIPRQILNAGSDPTGAVRLQLAKRLQEERDMTPEAADWTVDSWAAALNVDLGGPIGGGLGGEVTRTIPAGGDDDSPPPPQRRGLYIALAVVAGLIVAGVFVVIANPFRGGGVGQSSSSPSPTAVVTAEPSDEPTPEPSDPPPTATPTPGPEDLLLRRVNSAIRDTCFTSTWTDVGDPIAQVMCEIDGMDSISYLLYESIDDMRAAYDEWVFIDEKDVGDCAEGETPAEHGWAVTGYTGRELGRYFCFKGDTAWMVWTTDYARIMSIGYRDDGSVKQLYRAWTAFEVRPVRGGQ
ncbi:MAG TPA: hypothetical protein VFK36_05500 [Gemmatimonadales bacterium]|nr:hypothetical protein [Gemmatimonadales bacterium]